MTAPFRNGQKTPSGRRRLGVSVTLATGRCFPPHAHYAVELGLDLPLLTYQGALVQYVDGKVVYHRSLEPGQARENRGSYYFLRLSSHSLY